MTTVYSEPRRYGLELLASVDLAGAWEFHIVAVWRRFDGRIVWAVDSGCSCPTPFDGHGLLDLSEAQDMAELSQKLSDYWRGLDRDLYRVGNGDKWRSFLRAVLGDAAPPELIR